jgi:penicillin-binding protein 2
MSDTSQINSRSILVRGLFIAMAVILMVRLFMLQMVDDKYKVLADDQAIFKKVIFPARGEILDRKGRNLLVNEVTYDLMVTPNKLKDLDTTMFCEVMHIDIDEFKRIMKKVINKNGYVRPSVFYTSLTPEQNVRIQENLYLFNGFEIIERTERKYPLGIGGHIFGYINEISPARLQMERYASYRQGDYVGINGLENVYEEVLRGQRGVEYWVRDVLNRPQDSYRDGALDTPAIAGKSLELYLDADLQAYGEKLMQNKIGSVVAIDPKTGGILAMVSSPSYDPNLLTGANFSQNFNKLYNDYTRPLFNKATQATYPPGSTFKPVTGLVALDQGVITPSFGLGCAGGYYQCGKRIGCTHSNAGHAANMRVAMANSCNSYFCHLLRLIVDSKKYGDVKQGLQAWYEYMKVFGFGVQLGIDITGEYPGFIPDSTFLNKRYNNTWNSCMLAFMGMGQGEVTVTPIQMANAMCIIANRGYYYIPHFVKSIGGDEQHEMLKKYRTRVDALTHVSKEAYDAIINGMVDVTVAGTGKVARLEGVNVASKTGTAENYVNLYGKQTKLDNHSVFVCFAPAEDPKIAIAVIVQNSGYGATWAGPVASLMMEKYLTDTVKRFALEERMFNGNTIKKYIYTIDSLNREKDRMRDLLRTADQRTQDSIRKIRDNYLIENMLNKYYKLGARRDQEYPSNLD